MGFGFSGLNFWADFKAPGFIGILYFSQVLGSTDSYRGNKKKKLTDIGFFGFSWIGKRLFSMDLDLSR